MKSRLPSKCKVRTDTEGLDIIMRTVVNFRNEYKSCESKNTANDGNINEGAIMIENLPMKYVYALIKHHKLYLKFL